MGARTTTGNGAVSNVTGTVLDGSTALATTDTLTDSHVITIDASTVCGSSPSTGGTPAIKFDAAVSGKSVTVNAGISLTCKGDFKFDSAGTSGLALSAGSTFSFLTASAQQYNFIAASGLISYIDCNGSTGSHVTVKTDKSLGGLAAYTDFSSYYSQGFRTVTYTDFIDLGTTSNYGVVTGRGTNATFADASITDSTFTRCTYDFIGGGNWNGTYAFERNAFLSSVTISAGGYAVCANFDVSDVGSNPVTIQHNGFDYDVLLNNFPARQVFKNNILREWFTGGVGPAASSQVSGNIFTGPDEMLVKFSLLDSYAYSPDTTNPHFFSSQAANVSYDGIVFDGVATSADGDCIILPTAAGNVTVQRCLVTAKTNAAAGKLISTPNTSGAITCEHNTLVGLTEQGLIGLDEGTSSYTGQVASCKSNVVAASAAGTRCFVIQSLAVGGSALDAVTVSDYNVTQNASTGTCKHNTSTSQGSVSGYDGITVSTAGAFPNAQVGAHDFSADPAFVDFTRDLITWGVLKGTASTAAAAIAWAVAHPVEATDATTGLRVWVREGHQVTNPLLEDAGHDSVTIGAMGYVAASTGRTGMNHRTLRPY